MGKCSFQSACFFNNLMQSKPRTLEYLEEEFCNGNYFKCARYMICVSQGSGGVPKYLLPEDTLEACKLLDELE
jgi:hypothetical protein